MKTVLVFGPFACSSGHFETDLEFTLDNMNAGNKVYFIPCDASLTACDPNPTHKFSRCLECTSTSSRSLDTIGFPRSQRLSLNIQDSIPDSEMPRWKNLAELQQFQWKGLPVGRGAANSVIAASGDSDPSMETWGKFARESASMYYGVYCSVSRYIDQVRPDVFYVFNGKSSLMNAGYMAAQHKKVFTYVGERDWYAEYVLLENAISVDITWVKNQVKRIAKQYENDPDGYRLGSGWYEANRNGNAEILCNYLAAQEVGELPVGFNPKLRNIVIFGSSEDEIKAVPGWENPLYPSQTEALIDIATNCKKEGLHFYLRTHPHLTDRENTQTRELAKLNFTNLTVIPPESKVDTYAIMEACEKTITFGSTVGIEATYWKKPSIMVGRASYEDLDAVYRPRTREEFFKLVMDKIPPCDQVRAVQYGYWWRKRGQRMKYITPIQPSVGGTSLYQGVPLDASPMAKTVIAWEHRLERIKKEGLTSFVRSAIERKISPLKKAA